MSTQEISAQGRQIESDVGHALGGVEAMLKQAASATGEKAGELRDQAMRRLSSIRETLLDTQDAVMSRGRGAAHAADDYVHENPWRTLGATAALCIAVGLLIGLLADRR